MLPASECPANVKQRFVILGSGKQDVEAVSVLDTNII